jgi:hypothetical protein
VAREAGEARGSIILRLITAFAVAAVALSLWVGFFYGGDFKKALRAWSGQAELPATSLGSVQVEAKGMSRLDGSCKDAAIATKATDAALGSAKTDARDLCAADPKARGDVRLSMRLDTPGEPLLKTNGKKCIARVEQTWTCVFDSR